MNASKQWSEDIGDFTTWLRAAGQAEGTIKLRRWGLLKLAEHGNPAGPRDITPDVLHSWIANPAWSPNTRKSARATIRRFFQWENATQRRADDPAALLLGVRIPPATPRPTPAEIVRVHADDVEDGFLLVTGKGGRRRFVPIHPVLAPHLEVVRIRGGWAFPGRFAGHCHPDHVGKHLARLLGSGWTGHTLRHRFATEAYRGSRDLRAVQELLGHASVATTQIYVGLDTEALTNAVLQIPPLGPSS